jgi:hypothetical protein
MRNVGAGPATRKHAWATLLAVQEFAEFDLAEAALHTSESATDTRVNHGRSRSAYPRYDPE